MKTASWLHSAKHFLRAVFRREQVEAELDEELRFHAEQEARQHGLPSQVSLEMQKERCRDVRRANWLEQFLQDLRYGVRTLRRSPALATIAVLSLGLGAGANTAIFSLIDKLLLESLPVERPRELAILAPRGPRPGWTPGTNTWSYRQYRALVAGQQVFSGLLASRTDTLNFGIDNGTRRAVVTVVSGNYFQVLGLRAAAGRLLTPEDDQRPGGHPVAVITHGFWVDALGARPDVVGQVVQLNKNPFTVAGVIESGFNGLEVGGTADVFVTASMLAQATGYGGALDSRTAFIWQLYGRLQPGIGRDRAAAQLRTLYVSHLEAEMPPEVSRENISRARLELLDGHRGTSGLRRSLETPLVALMILTGLLLMLACANIAGLLIARAASRAGEISIRLALGASRGRLIRQLLAESLLLSVAASVFGVVVAWLTVRLVLTQLGEAGGRLQTVMSFLDLRLLGYALACTAVTSVSCGLLPALKTSRAPVGASLKSAVAAATGGNAGVRRWLVTAQVAIGLVLLSASGLFVKTLSNLRGTDTGYQTDRLLHFRLNPASAGYERGRRISYFDSVLDELRTQPGVSAATIAAEPLLANSMIGFGSIEIEGYSGPNGAKGNASANAVAPGYFQMMSVPVLRGREFAASDTMTSLRVAVVNEEFVRRYFPSSDPIGHTISLAYGGPPQYTHQIVGIAKDARLNNLRDRPEPNFFLPYAQFDVLSAASIYVRHGREAGNLASSIQQLVSRRDPSIPVIGLRSVDEEVDRLLLAERLTAHLSTVLGAMAALLSAIGLYGVTAYSVTRRTREIGIRVALGAGAWSIVSMVLRDVAVTCLVGLVLGVAAALTVSRYLESQLYGVAPRDIATLALACATMGILALVAGWLPARRASRTDPLVALRLD